MGVGLRTKAFSVGINVNIPDFLSATIDPMSLLSPTSRHVFVTFLKGFEFPGFAACCFLDLELSHTCRWHNKHETLQGSSTRSCSTTKSREVLSRRIKKFGSLGRYRYTAANKRGGACYYYTSIVLCCCCFYLEC